jgi:threonine-phosphate decarboxylase
MKRHGGDIYAASRELDIPAGKVIDFSASINPLGVPKSVRDEIIAHLGHLCHYPDPSAVELRQEISLSIGVAQEHIICGNGSTELIYLIARALQPKRVLIPSPTFSEYENAINICRGSSRCARIAYYDLRERNCFKLDADEFIDAMTGCDIAFICNPNNPTGGTIKKSDMLKIVKAAGETNCNLVVDEAFIDFIPRESVIKETLSNPHLIILRSLTKFYALSGLRIGYAVIHPELSDTIGRFKEPWTVNTLAQLAGVAALKDTVYAGRTFDIVKEEKRYLEKEFRRLGIEYYPSRINFYLLRLNNADAIVSNLKTKGILVRDCSNFRSLDSSYIRIAVRSRNENSRLLRGLAGL